MQRVLLIDDDERLFELLEEYLRGHDVNVKWAPDGGRGLALLEGQAFDAVFLDVMMPGLDGLEVLRRIRQKSQVPVLMLTAKGDETDRVVGLEMGADDYVPKPFAPRELLARLRAVLRRADGKMPREILEVGTLRVDVAGRQVQNAGAEIDLTGLEFDLLLALVKRAGRVLPRDALLEAAGRGDIVVSERTVDVHISHLRQKLGDSSWIKTVRGVGYLFAGPPA